jgi:hypothetical protein
MKILLHRIRVLGFKVKQLFSTVKHLKLREKTISFHFTTKILEYEIKVTRRMKLNNQMIKIHINVIILVELESSLHMAFVYFETKSQCQCLHIIFFPRTCRYSISLLYYRISMLYHFTCPNFTIEFGTVFGNREKK